jgi:hypothetical protein
MKKNEEEPQPIRPIESETPMQFKPMPIVLSVEEQIINWTESLNPDDVRVVLDNMKVILDTWESVKNVPENVMPEIVKSPNYFFKEVYFMLWPILSGMK